MRYRAGGARAVERRRTPRFEGRVRVFVHTLRGPVAGEILDASLTGFRIRIPSAIPVPPVTRLKIPDHGVEVPVQMVWSRSQIYGWRISYNGAQVGRVMAAIADLADRIRTAPPAVPAVSARWRGTRV